MSFFLFFLAIQKKFFNGSIKSLEPVCPFIIIINGPSFPTSAAKIDPRDESISFFLSLSGEWGKEGGRGDGVWGEGKEERGGKSCPFSDLSSPCR